MRSPCRPALLAALFLASTDLTAQQQLGPPMSEAALRARLEAYTADSMRGRLTGTPDNVKATHYIADELRKAGLEPGGDNGTFLQRVPLVQSALDRSVSSVTAAGTVLAPYENYLPRNQGPNARAFDGAPVVFAGVWGAPGLLGGEAVRGKTVVLATPIDNSSVIKLQAQAQFAQAAAIVIANYELMSPTVLAAVSQSPTIPGESGPAGGPDLPSYLHITRATAARVLGVGDLADAAPGREGTPITGRIAFAWQPAEAYNVVAILRGSDAALRNEFVAVGAHSDHVGIAPPEDRDSLRAFNLELRAKQLAAGGEITQAMVNSIRVNMDSIRRAHPVPRLDSIYNGADDDGSGSMAVLEVARALAADRAHPKRSIVFVWHTGEELGLFGADYFTRRPTVAREQIVAQLNLDMVGRGKPGDEIDGGPNYLQLIGSRRLSTQLGDLVESVSRDKGYQWAFDYQYDAAGHPEQYYCRSDHYMYARFGIPVVFMSTGGHADYHQVTDEVEYIDFAKLAKVARYTRDLAEAVANGASRPVVDKPRPDPNGNCVQ